VINSATIYIACVIRCCVKSRNEHMFNCHYEFETLNRLPVLNLTNERIRQVIMPPATHSATMGGTKDRNLMRVS
jgi:hypothetical protein